MVDSFVAELGILVAAVLLSYLFDVVNLFHELGHAIAGKLLEYKIEKISLRPLNSYIKFNCEPVRVPSRHRKIIGAMGGLMEALVFLILYFVFLRSFAYFPVWISFNTVKIVNLAFLMTFPFSIFSAYVESFNNYWYRQVKSMTPKSFIISIVSVVFAYLVWWTIAYEYNSSLYAELVVTRIIQ